MVQGIRHEGLRLKEQIVRLFVCSVFLCLGFFGGGQLNEDILPLLSVVSLFLSLNCFLTVYKQR